MNPMLIKKSFTTIITAVVVIAAVLEAADFYVGPAGDDNYQPFFNGHIAEILVFGQILTPDERFRMLAYLTGKWEL